MRRRTQLSTLVLVSAIASITACKGDAGKSGWIAAVTAIGPGGNCPAGGTQIAVGPDKNGNGVLDDNEIQGAPEVVCSSGTTLSSETTLSAGDDHCPTGGTRLDIGIDNGDGGGTAGDGTLQSGEVDSSQYVCAPGSTLTTLPLTEPASPVGTATLDLSGGTGATSHGGDGGGLVVTAEAGTDGGHIKVFKNGTADVTFTVPTVTTVPLGPTPWQVAAPGATLKNVTTTTGLVDGDVYTLNTSHAVLRWNASTSSGEPVTGIQVAASATLVIEAPSGDNAAISIANAFVNAGTITTQQLPDGFSRNGLSITTVAFVGADGSRIDLHGNDNGGGAGGNAGSLEIALSGAFINRGTISAYGGNGTTGGFGGGIEIAAGNDTPSFLANTGAIDVHAGNGTTGKGGTGGTVALSTEIGVVYNSGAVNLSGGDSAGTAQGGGAGGLSATSTSGGGDVLNAGAITARGGAAGSTCTGTPCGSDGGGVVFIVAGGRVASSGAIDVSGGNGGTGAAGMGGGFVIESISIPSSPPMPAGGIQVSGALTLHGGNGAVGGGGGTVEILLAPVQSVSPIEIVFSGYTNVTLNGGDGQTDGGAGGVVSIQHLQPTQGAAGPFGPSGSVVISSNLTLNGGNGSTGQGGGVQSFTARTQAVVKYQSSLERVIISGNVSANGGNGATSGGSAGPSMNIYANDGVTITGQLSSNGGNATAGGGGTAGHIQIDGDGATQIGSMSLVGGNGSTAGSAGGGVKAYGGLVTASGTINASGGNGGSAGGGAGGFVEIASRHGSTNNTETFTLNGGTGTPSGSAGAAAVDGIIVQGTAD